MHTYAPAAKIIRCKTHILVFNIDRLANFLFFTQYAMIVPFGLFL